MKESLVDPVEHFETTLMASYHHKVFFKLTMSPQVNNIFYGLIQLDYCKIVLGWTCES